jgi:hypothetical protein
VLVTHPKDPKDPHDIDSIPVLTDVIKPGKPLEQAVQAAQATQAAHAEAAPEAKGEPESLPQEPDSSSHPPVSEPEPKPEGAVAPVSTTELAAELADLTESAESAEAAKATDTSALAAPLEHEVPAAAELGAQADAESPAAAASFGSAASSVSHNPGSVRTHVSTEVSRPSEARELDVDLIAERVRSRFTGYLRDEGRALIQARCRDALEEHTNWLVRQMTREVTLALEAEVGRWVQDAVHEILAAQTSSKR